MELCRKFFDKFIWPQLAPSQYKPGYVPGSNTVIILFIILMDNGLMDKSLAQSTISKSKPVSSSSKGEDDCDKKCKNKPETIKSVHF